MSEYLLEVNDLDVTYEVNNETIKAVNGISFKLNKKESLGIVGEAGAGKTTTAMSILGLLPHKVGFIKNGDIKFKGQNLLEQDKEYIRMIRGEVISMIFQDPMTSLNPVMTVGKQIAEVLEFHEKVSQTNEGVITKKKYSKEEIDKKIDDILVLVGISPDRKYDYPHQLSGGMKQRVVIAIALICNPQLLIADEPTSALDVTIQAQILDLIDSLKEKFETSVIMITHDLGVVAETCDKVAVMYAGEFVEIGTIKDIFTGDKHHPYTLGLLNSIPNIESNKERLSTISGLMPDPTKLPKGCKFHERCSSCMDICKTNEPSEYVEGEHKILCHLYK